MFEGWWAAVRRAATLVLLVGWMIAIGCPGASGGEALGNQDGQAGAFARGTVTEFRIGLDSAAEASLRTNPREYVSASLRCGEVVYPRVAVKLKGGVGSFQTLDGKPSWTVDFSRYERGRSWEGAERVQLNNSVEDPGFLHEALGAELFRAAGIAVPRVAHARVWVGQRSLGLYVLKEGFCEGFLRRSFSRADGAVFDNDRGSDVDQSLHQSEGAVVAGGGSALARLAQASAEPRLEVRWERMNRFLDVDRFLTYLAMEILVGHRDGYGIARNNFRIYLDPDGGRAMFLPDGMDQLFGREPFPLRPSWGGLVARALLETPQGSAGYDERLRRLLETVVTPTRITNLVRQWTSALQPNLRAAEVVVIRRESVDLVDRIVQRDRDLRERIRVEVGRTEPVPVFVDGIARLANWSPRDGTDDVRLIEERSPEDGWVLRIRAARASSASWRCAVRLEPGRYRFEGRVRVAGVIPIARSQSRGAGLRVQGGKRSGDGLVGESGWRVLACEVEVVEKAARVELICELAAEAGEMWIDAGSLRLVRVSEQLR